MSQRDGLLLLGRGYDDNNNKKKSLRTYPYGLEGFLAAGSAFPLENETMTKCMQWKDQIAYRCPLGLIPPGVMNCVCVYTNLLRYYSRSPDPASTWIYLVFRRQVGIKIYLLKCEALAVQMVIGKPLGIILSVFRLQLTEFSTAGRFPSNGTCIHLGRVKMIFTHEQI